MFIITQKKEFVIKLTCVLILFGLCVAIFINGKELSCDNCQIKFTSMKEGYENSEVQPQFMELLLNITELYKGYIDDKCVLKFDKNGGFIYARQWNFDEG